MTKNDDPEPVQLAGGGAPATQDDVLTTLAGLGIEHHTFQHAPVFTVAEAKALRGDLKGAHIKNLFLRNKKGHMWLITCHEDRRIDLRRLGELVGAGRLSFASPQRLMRYLGVIPGAVTPLGAMNDTTGAVSVVLDEAILNDTLVNVHPLHNGATTSLSPAALLMFLRSVGHEPTIIDMDELQLDAP